MFIRNGSSGEGPMCLDVDRWCSLFSIHSLPFCSVRVRLCETMFVLLSTVRLLRFVDVSRVWVCLWNFIAFYRCGRRHHDIRIRTCASTFTLAATQFGMVVLLRQRRYVLRSNCFVWRSEAGRHIDCVSVTTDVAYVFVWTVVWFRKMLHKLQNMVFGGHIIEYVSWWNDLRR